MGEQAGERVVCEDEHLQPMEAAKKGRERELPGRGRFLTCRKGRERGLPGREFFYLPQRAGKGTAIGVGAFSHLLIDSLSPPRRLLLERLSLVTTQRAESASVPVALPLRQPRGKELPGSVSWFRAPLPDTHSPPLK